MILLRQATGSSSRAAVIVGLGLIGSALASNLTRIGWRIVRRLAVDWSRPDDVATQLDALSGDPVGASAATDAGSGEGPLAVVWCAGRAGFGATEAETRGEFENFRQVVDCAERLAAERPLDFHMLSSAGGLYEGQRLVGPTSRPSPLRPYGELKLRQEALLAQMRGARREVVYRPTAVFGYVRPGRRMGLVPTLVMNGLRHGVTAIQGRMTTLREFIWIEDLASYLAAALTAGDEAERAKTVVLSSCKPCSILEVRKLVEDALGRRIYVSVSREAANDEHITFAPGAVPPDWRSTDLGTSVRRVVAEAVRQGVARKPRPAAAGLGG